MKFFQVWFRFALWILRGMFLDIQSVSFWQRACAETRGDVNTTTFLADAKIVYGSIQNQVSMEPNIINLFSDGSKMGQPINNIGIRGYVFLARLGPNWNMGFRPEGVTGVGAAGAQNMAQATVGLKYGYVPVVITGQAENLSKGQQRAFMQAKALEAKYDTQDFTSHLNVIVAGAERGGQLAQVVTPGAGSFTADNAGNLPGAIYLRVNMPIDTGAVGGGANTITNAVITAINYGSRLVTVPGTAVTGNAVYLAGEAPPSSGVFPYTIEGLVSLVSNTGAIEGLDPAVQAQTAWASYLKDVGAVALSPALLQQLRQFVYNRGGEQPDLFLVPSAQINQYVTIATATLRFDVTWPQGSVGKRALDLGFATYTFAGLPMVESKDLRPDRIYCGASDTMKKFEAVPLAMADDEAGTWTRISGASGVADAEVGLLRNYLQIGITQRSAWGVAKNFTIPTDFQTAAPTL
jgi:hypothetical protein